MTIPRLGGAIAVTVAIVAVAIAAVGSACRDEKPKAAPPAADTPTTPVWADTTRDLYFKIPVTVRFTPKNEPLERQVWAYLESIDDHFNSYRADSEVGKLNRRADLRGAVEVSVPMRDALVAAVELHKETEGAFDITVAPLIRRWQMAVRENKLPTAAELKTVLADVGLDAVELAGTTLTVRDGRRAFDFGGMIKGTAADRAVQMLRDGGASAAFVQVGGETCSYGHGKDGRVFELAVDDPNDPSREFARVKAPANGFSATTSGNYRKPQVVAGQTYYHIVDPRTGQPVSTRTLSATVMFAETGKTGLADGLTTAIAVLGADRGIEIVEKLGGAALVVIEKDGAVVVRRSTNLSKFVRAIPGDAAR